MLMIYRTPEKAVDVRTPQANLIVLLMRIKALQNFPLSSWVYVVASSPLHWWFSAIMHVTTSLPLSLVPAFFFFLTSLCILLQSACYSFHPETKSISLFIKCCWDWLSPVEWNSGDNMPSPALCERFLSFFIYSLESLSGCHMSKVGPAPHGPGITISPADSQ